MGQGIVGSKILDEYLIELHGAGGVAAELDRFEDLYIASTVDMYILCKNVLHVALVFA